MWGFQILISQINEKAETSLQCLWRGGQSPAGKLVLALLNIAKNHPGYNMCRGMERVDNLSNKLLEI